jgi:D-ribose pyranase
MIKKGIFHPQLLRVLGEMRHMDTIVIGDAGLPIPKGVERIDLGWIEGEPGYHKVLEEILKYIIVEKAVFANEAKEVSSQFLEKSIHMLPTGLGLEYVDHVELKKRSGHAKAIILTGEFTPYANVILVGGCAY